MSQPKASLKDRDTPINTNRGLSDFELLEIDQSYNMLPLIERIGKNKAITHGYAKHPDTGGENTGEVLLINKIPNLAVVDIDVPKDATEEETKYIRADLLRLLHPDDLVVKTGGGGLHIYCNMDNFILPSNGSIGIVKTDRFSVDIFICADPDKRQLVVMEGSRTRKDEETGPKTTKSAVSCSTEKKPKKPILKYEWIRGSYASMVKRSINEVLHDLQLTIKSEKHQPFDVATIMHDTVDDQITDDLAETLVGGIFGFTIHNDGGGMPIDKEITLFTLFQTLNSLPEAYIERAYDAAYSNCTLTITARGNWDKAQDRYSQMCTSPYVLAKMIKYHNSDYYDSMLRSKLNVMHSSVVSEIEIADRFDLTEMIKKAEQGLYKKEKDVLIDLSKFVRRINATKIMNIEKIYNALYDAYEVAHVKDTDMEKKLKTVKLWKEEKKQVTAWNVFDHNSSQLTVRGVLFHSYDPNIYSLFRGYKFNARVTPDLSIIDIFLDFVKHVIAGDDETIYEYILNWIALIMQKPGIKTQVSLLL